jgi:hypothetical protein
MTQHRDLFAALAAPFQTDEVRSRPQGGRQVPYVTARTVMNRFDEVLGPENWWDDYVPLEHSVICRLTIRLPDGSTLTKCDAGGYAGMADRGDDDKSGFADAFKRTAVKFGVGRYLYRDGVPGFARQVTDPQPAARDTSSEIHHEPPRSAGEPNESQAETRVSLLESVLSSPSREWTETPGRPRSGRALFAWVKELDEKHDYGLLKHLNGWGKRQDFPTRLVDWDEEQVHRGHREASRKVRSIQMVQHATEMALSN